ncbi:hypothetical protein [Photorhabdus viridis]|uniref:hypothetical protein n=1 Tax=Photorhabdus viridis TaxID=3163327 RepID=UPI0033078E54
MNKIAGITIDKQLADNISGSQSEPQETQRIQVTVTVMNGNTAAQSGITVYWNTTVNFSNMLIFDESMNRILPLPGQVNTFTTITNGWGNTIIYIASSIKIITNITASLILPEEGESPDYEQTLVFCTFDHSGTFTSPKLPKPGTLNILSSHYSVEATGGIVSGPNYWCAAWLYGKTDGYLDDAIKGRLIDVFPVNKDAQVCFKVPYQWLDTKNQSGNQLAYFLHSINGNPILSKKLYFSAIGTATAMPDIDESGDQEYKKVEYLYTPAVSGYLTNNDLNAHGDILDFYISPYPDFNNNDKLEINIYLNGCDSNGVNNRHSQIQKIKNLGDLVWKNNQRTFSILKDEVTDFRKGDMFIRYEVNDYYLSMVYRVKIEFSDIS